MVFNASGSAARERVVMPTRVAVSATIDDILTTKKFGSAGETVVKELLERGSFNRLVFF